MSSSGMLHQEEGQDLILDNKSVNIKLIADVVHKVKNSLGGIGGFAALLERDLEPDSSSQRMVHRIQDGVLRLNDFVVNLMLLVRNQEVEKKKVKIMRLITEVYDSYLGDQERLFESVRIESLFAEGHEEIQADPDLFRQMIYHGIQFSNYFGSSIEHILVSGQNNKIAVNIDMKGPICPDVPVERIHQFINTCEPIEARLSLAIVQKIAQLHQGEVSLASEDDGLSTMKIVISKG